MADRVKKDTRDPKVIIATRVAPELKDGDVVNFGIGLPVMVANCLPEGVEIILQSERGSSRSDRSEDRKGRFICLDEMMRGVGVTRGT